MRLAVLSTRQIPAHTILMKPCERSAVKETEAQGGSVPQSKFIQTESARAGGHVGSRAPDSMSSPHVELSNPDLQGQLVSEVYRLSVGYRLKWAPEQGVEADLVCVV